MQTVALLTLLLVASASAGPSQPEQAPNGNPVSGQAQAAPSVGGSPVVQPAGVGASSGVVDQSANIEQPPHHHHPSMASYYAPAGMISVIGGGEQGAVGNNKVPVGSQVRNFEQYGQPESASIPPNYKPFGSWGLYIGGNPADGYYTNYYKALSSSIDKQQQAEPAKPVGGQAGSQMAAFSPVVKQASSYGGDYYPFAYSPSELNSGARIGVEPVPHSSQVVSPVQAGAQVYGSPSAFESNYGVSPYTPDTYAATKKMGAVYAQKEMKEPAGGPKGYQSRVYVYPPMVGSPVGPMSAPGVSQAVAGGQQQPQQQQQVVAYPVPVGSQIVGSQQGVDGGFYPYGVHAFTRYAVKPTVVQSDPSYYYGNYQGVVPSGAQMPAGPVYKQQAVYSGQQVGGQGASYYPMSFYGYPINQLHYSQGSIVPSIHGGEPHYSPVQPGGPQVDGIEKSEVDEKSVSMKQQQKRA